LISEARESSPERTLRRGTSGQKEKENEHDTES
jgi:hypothetical protein